MRKKDRTTTALRPAQLGHRRFEARNADRTRTTWFTWRHLRCKILETPNWGANDWTFLRLEIIAPRDTPCPITTTGYLAHGVDAAELAAAGGTVSFLTAWLDREAAKKPYQKAEFRWRQGDLLDQLTLEEDREA
jgi:hypothetical protein